MKKFAGLSLSGRTLAVAIITFLAIALVAAIGLALYVTYVVSPVIAARRTFLHRLTERGGSFVAFTGENPCACSPWERGRYHLKDISPQTIRESWNLARDWALWRLTAVSLKFPKGVSLTEPWIATGLAVMPPVCTVEFSSATIMDNDVRVLLSMRPPMLQGSFVQSMVFKECVLHGGALESFLKGVSPRVWVALDSCDILDAAMRDGNERIGVYGLSVLRMELDEQQWRALFSRVSCRHLQVLLCEGFSSGVWDEILGMALLEEAEIAFGDQSTVDAFISSSVTNTSAKNLSVYIHDPSFADSFPELVKALAAKFPTVKALTLSTLEMSDDSLQYLTSLQHLETLALHANQIVGPLKTLEDCRSLRCIKFYAKHVSGEATLELLRKRGIEVYYENTSTSVLPVPR